MCLESWSHRIWDRSTVGSACGYQTKVTCVYHKPTIGASEVNQGYWPSHTMWLIRPLVSMWATEVNQGLLDVDQGHIDWLWRPLVFIACDVARLCQECMLECGETWTSSRNVKSLWTTRLNYCEQQGQASIRSTLGGGMFS